MHACVIMLPFCSVIPYLQKAWSLVSECLLQQPHTFWFWEDLWWRDISRSPWWPQDTSLLHTVHLKLWGSSQSCVANGLPSWLKLSFITCCSTKLSGCSPCSRVPFMLFGRARLKITFYKLIRGTILKGIIQVLIQVHRDSPRQTVQSGHTRDQDKEHTCTCSIV